MVTTYAEAGVSIREGDRFVERIKGPIRSTFTKGVIGDIGLFGGFFDASFKAYRSPVLVSSMDGVGTKLKVAQLMNRHDTIGEDLVNHCVNDIAVCGAKPLFFLDYLATGKLDSDVATQIVSGFVRACKRNKCALIGGETAEMPGLYQDGDYDICGTIVGVVDRKKIVTGQQIRKGDVLIGLPSTGLHTNGYSLARSTLLRMHDVNDYLEELGTTVGEALLTVHRSYLKIISAVLHRFDVRGLAHITGGGVVGNTMRVVPRGFSLHVDWEAWKRPPIFQLIQRLGGVPEEDMRRTFNLGIGLIMIVAGKESDDVLRFLRKKGEQPRIVGTIAKEKRK